MRFDRHTLVHTLSVVVLLVSLLGNYGVRAAEASAEKPYVDLLTQDRWKEKQASLKVVEENWHPGSVIMLLEILHLSKDTDVSDAILRLIQKKTGKRGIESIDDWYQWIWSRPYEPHPAYSEFKQALYALVDPRFSEYFDNDPATTIRLDEIRWGGVRRDGIPPLKNPKMVSVPQATYLRDSDIIFGVEINGDARAYPKRILAWHEMFKDTVGSIPINGVYCTLCGSMIVYKTEINGHPHELGTSGFLYRSNKLMYDHATKSMWSTLQGEPVVGPLVGKGLKLETLYVVTTTWGKWKELHPETTVLSLDTGYKRNYEEGVAYKKYFSNHRLMFDVPNQLKDRRLKNKDEVFVIRTDQSHQSPLAFSTRFLTNNTLYHAKLEGFSFVIVTDQSGASRAYDSRDVKFTTLIDDHALIDQTGAVWLLTESDLSSVTGEKIPRIPAHRAFWFGWRSAYPDTLLIK